MERHDFTDPMSGNTGAYRALHVEAYTAFIRMIPRFLITWRDAEKRQQFLGDLSTDCNDTECFLVLYLSVDQRQLLLYLHLPLRINTTSKGIKNTYMVIPAESFDAARHGSRRIVFDPRETPDLDKKGIEAGTELIQARFELKKQGFVAMSAGKTQKLISKRARGLLLSLKSLSQADSFDVFVRNSDLNEFVVTTFFDALSKGNTQTPTINYKATFNGRPWGKEAWKTYNLRKDDNLQEVWNPLRDENPPSYAQAVELSSQAASALSPNKLDVPTKPNFSSRPSTTQAISMPDTTTPSESEIEAQDVEHLDGEMQHGRAESLEPQDGRLEADDGQSDSQETVRVQDDLQETRGREVTAVGQEQHDGPQQDRPRKRNAREALLDTETDGGSRSAVTRPALDREIRREATEVAVYVDDNQALDEQASSAQVSLENEAVRIILGGEYRFSPVSVFCITGKNHHLFNKAQFRWFCDAALWLSTTWCNDHSVHSLYWNELNELCRAIRLQDREGYLKIRIRCMYSFTEEERSGEDEGPFAYKLIDRTRWMVDLINNELGLGHDSLIVDELTAMHQAARRWMKVGGDTVTEIRDKSQEYIRRENGFYLQMAACLLVALCKNEHNWNEDWTKDKGDEETQHEAQRMP